VATLDQLSLDLLDSYELVHPMAWAIPAPLFASVAPVRLAEEPRILKEKHLKLPLQQNGAKLDVMWFNAAMSIYRPALGYRLPHQPQYLQGTLQRLCGSRGVADFQVIRPICPIRQILPIMFTILATLIISRSGPAVRRLRFRLFLGGHGQADPILRRRHRDPPHGHHRSIHHRLPPRKAQRGFRDCGSRGRVLTSPIRSRNPSL